MSIFSYKSGDCGVGYFKSIIIVNILVLLSFVPNMTVLLSWLSSGTYGNLVIPLLMENALVIPSWVSGGLAVIPGTFALFSRAAGQRNILLNVWVASLAVYAVLITAAGIYLVYNIAEDRNLADAIANDLGAGARKRLGSYGPRKGGNMEKLGTRLREYGQQIGFWYLYKSLPYPASGIFFLYWQIGVTSFAFCVIPSLMGFWALYHALGNRNYFAKNPDAYNDQAIADGPIHSDSEGEDSEADSYLSDDDDLVPLSNRAYETNSNVTRVQSDEASTTRRAKGVRGKVV